MRILPAFALATMFAASSSGAVVTLDFEGLRNLEPVNEFYNGGLGGNGSGPGTNYGISFSTTSLAIVDQDAGGSGNFGGEPSPSTVLFFLSGTAIMNVAAGFDTGFSFFYSAVNAPGSVDVYSDLNGTGTLLATIVLPVTPSNGGDPSGNFSPFFPVGVSFSGIARSIDFGGTVNQIGFDNVTFGSEVPGGSGAIPEPGTYALLAGGLGLLVLQRRAAG